MIRSYALVIMDKQDKIIDRYPLELVTNPTGAGFKLKISTIATDIEDVITKVVQEKPPINMVVNQVNNSYQRADLLASWIQKYSTAEYKMFLEHKYNNGQTTRYCGGKVTDLSKDEKDEFGNIAQKLVFTMTTPFFVKKENDILFQFSNVGKKYPFTYPYMYGEQTVENNEINNPYILEIPLIISIYGAVTKPTIDLLDENGNSYSKVQFDNFDLKKGEKLVINSAQKKIYKVLVDEQGKEQGEQVDFRPEVNPEFDTFLLAKRGITRININVAEAKEGFKLIGGWRQYTL